MALAKLIKLTVACGSMVSIAGFNSSNSNRHFQVSWKKVIPVDSEVKSIGPYTSPLDGVASGATWSHPVVGKSGIASISVHLTVRNPTLSTNWEIRVRNSGSVLVDTIRGDSERGKVADVWSADVPGNVAIVELVNTQQTDITNNHVQLTIDLYSFPSEPSIPQALWAHDMKSITSVGPDIQRVGRSVARVRIKKNIGEGLCTGFLLTDNLLLTNFHCIATAREAINSWADFGYNQRGRKYDTYKVSKLECVNYRDALDYAIVRVDGHPGQKFGHIGIPQDRPTQFSPDDLSLLLIEHPAGGPKMVSITQCQVVGVTIPSIDADFPSDFGHHCDTLGGSSGSPIFSPTKFDLRGLHHIGFEETAKPGPLVNQGIYLGLIFSDIQAHASPIAREISDQPGN